MGSPVLDVVQRQHVTYRQYFFLLLLLLLHGYYNFIRLDGWFNGPLSLLKETITIIIVIQFCFSNYYASYDSKRHIAERNVRRATHTANITGSVFITFGLIWGCYLLTTHDIDTSGSENAFDIMNNRVYLLALMIIAFFIQLCFLNPGIGELEFLKYILRYPWRFIWPARQNEMFKGSV